MIIKSWFQARFIQIFANLLCFGYTLVVMYTWFSAWFNGGYVFVSINDLGEARMELLLWIVVFPAIAYGMYQNMRDLAKMRFEIRRRLLGGKYAKKIEWL